jgi:hypothetical protein
MTGILSAGFLLAGIFSGLEAIVAKDVPSYETDQNIVADHRFCSAT